MKLIYEMVLCVDVVSLAKLNPGVEEFYSGSTENSRFCIYYHSLPLPVW